MTATGSAAGPDLGVGARFGVESSARFVLTDRAGPRLSPSRPRRLERDALAVGASAPPYEQFDLADHVGDEPASVDANRAALLEHLGPGVMRLAFMDQVHGNDVAVVERATDPVPRADALVTVRRGVALTVLVADCAPVVLSDDAAGVLGAAHVGRRGVRNHVVLAVVAAMVREGADPARIEAVVGPSVCPACYEVPAAMCDEVADVVPEARATSRTGTPALHLRRAVVAQLVTAGVEQVDAVGACTVEDHSLFSYRRDGRTGRFAMLAWLPELG